jgi:hypothetical protein
MQFPLLKKLGLHHLLISAGYTQRLKYLRMLQLMISTRLSEEKHANNDLYSFVVDHLDNATDRITTSELWYEALFYFPAGVCLIIFSSFLPEAPLLLNAAMYSIGDRGGHNINYLERTVLLLITKS